MNWLPHLYCPGVDWIHRAFSCAWIGAVCGKAKRGVAPLVVEFKPDSLLLVPAGTAIWFMIWVLWNWWKEEKR